MNIPTLLVDKYSRFPIGMRKFLWQFWHKLLIRYDKDISANFMNYGYSSLNGDRPPVLAEKDEENRYCIQLYDQLARKVDLQDKEILEVGSGRGGGASYISRYYSPGKYIGMDISASIINFCNRYYNIPGLSFEKGSAEMLPYEDQSFDVLINVESARAYNNLDVFFKEVHRVLRPGGFFLITDMIEKQLVDRLFYLLIDNQFEAISVSNITKNVITALEKDTERREELIRNNIPGFLRKAFSHFAGSQGSARYFSFKDNTFEYWSYVLKKNGSTSW
jgi:ubiquinone/menaquinone biosynthesis C-methylase UbiE